MTKPTEETKPPDMWPGMTVDQHAAIVRYIEDALPVLELRDWTIGLDHFPIDDDENAFAMIQVTEGQKRATIALCRDFASIDPAKQRRVIAHELIHCHLDGPTRYLEATLPELVGRPATAAVVNAVHAHVETAVDALAEAIAPLLSDLSHA